MNIARYDKRIFAYLIDLIFACAFPAAGLVIAYAYVPSFYDIPWYFVAAMAIVAVWLVYTIINTLWTFLSNGRSLGNLIFGLKIIRPDMSHLHFSECLVRSINLGFFVSALVNAIYMLMIHTEKTVYDRLSETVVVDWRNRNI